MNILVCRWDIFPYDDIINSMKRLGHTVEVLDFDGIHRNLHADSVFMRTLKSKLKGSYILGKPFDVVFSVNYYVMIAEVCHEYHMQMDFQSFVNISGISVDTYEHYPEYICWNVDTPLLSMRHPSVKYPENVIYTFDMAEAKDFKACHFNNIHYLPLAGTPKIKAHASNSDFDYDVSFIGNLYDKNRYDELQKILPDYICGYLDACIEAQMNISGGNLLPSMLTDNIMNLIEPYIDVKNMSISLADKKLHIATSVLAYKTASRFRTKALNTLGKALGSRCIHLFTTSNTSCLSCVTVHPPVDYHTEAPEIFAKSRININMTAPNITSGLPLRIFDIISSGGFLLTDYRADLEKHFTPGKDVATYEDIDELTEKVRYYLTHEDERLEIARNGYDTLCKKHTYDKRLSQILDNQSLK